MQGVQLVQQDVKELEETFTNNQTLRKLKLVRNYTEMKENNFNFIILPELSRYDFAQEFGNFQLQGAYISFFFKR